MTTIKIIDQALNLALSGLIYGSEVWLVYAFSRYLLKRKQPNVQPSSLAAQNTGVLDILEKRTSEKRTSENKTSQKRTSENKTSQKMKNVPEKAVRAKKPILDTVLAKSSSALHEIRCEPVNWKVWKVGDMRKASIYKACGVRIRPIGSRRNLPKADLIAQYEQNLKRLTQSSRTADLDVTDVGNEKIA